MPKFHIIYSIWEGLVVIRFSIRLDGLVLEELQKDNLEGTENIIKLQHVSRMEEITIFAEGHWCSTFL